MLAPETFVPPSTMTAMMRGFRERCPRCGKGPIFKSLLKLTDNCSVCGEHLGDIRADDLPAYLTVLVVGHIVVPALLLFENYNFSTWAELSVAVPVSLALIAFLLPRFKGAAAGLLWVLAQQKKAVA
ncbi:MAG: DUF983 domain-containing protein [Aliidongia sp.]